MFYRLFPLLFLYTSSTTSTTTSTTSSISTTTSTTTSASFSTDSFILNTSTIVEETEVSLVVNTAVTYCDDTPNFSGATETTCTTIIAAGDSCTSVCPSSTVVSTCTKVTEEFLGMEFFLGETEWVHDGDCTDETETRTLEVSGISMTADSISDCEEQANEYISESIVDDLSSLCDSCNSITSEATCTDSSRRRRFARDTSTEYDVVLSIEIEEQVSSDDEDNDTDYSLIDLSSDSIASAVSAVVDDIDEIEVVAEVSIDNDETETATVVYEAEMETYTTTTTSTTTTSTTTTTTTITSTTTSSTTTSTTTTSTTTTATTTTTTTLSSEVLMLMEQNEKLTRHLTEMEQKYDKLIHRVSKAESKARRSQIMAAVESGTLRNELKKINGMVGQLSSQLTTKMTDMIAEFISLPPFLT